MEGPSQTTEARNEGENLLLRRTQGDLLQKLRQLQQWRQQQEEHLLQDKEKQLSVLRDKERRLHAVQEYQRKILQNNNVITSRDNGPLFQVKPASFSDGLSSRPTADTQLRENMAISQARAVMSSGYNLTTRTVLLSPQHFKTTMSSMNSCHVSPSLMPQNQMLLTQKLHLPLASDEELSQFTESDGGSIGVIEGIRPIGDTPSEISAASDDEDDLVSDHEDDNNNTLVHVDGDQYNQNDVDNNDPIDYSDQDNDNHDYDIDDHDNDDIDAIDHDIDDIDQDNDDIDQGYDDINNQDIDGKYGDDDEGMDEQAVGDQDLNSKPSFDDVPIKPGIGVQTRTFEELLNQQLQADQHQKQEEPSRTKTTVGPKKAFLKKGEGIARFGIKPKTDAVKPTALQEKNSKNNGMEQRAPVTRKTATAKDYATGKQPAVVAEASGIKQKAIVNHSATVKQSDRLQLDARKSNVSKFPTDRQTGGSITRQSLSHETDQEKQPFSPKKVQFNTRQLFPHGVLSEDVLEEDSASSSADEGVEVVEGIPGGSEVIIEDSFQERMQKWDELEVVEKQELNEFELLEEAAAANCSLSSNSSTVLRILGTKQVRRPADVNNNMLDARLKWNVIPKHAETVKVDNVANRTLTEENLDDDNDDTLKGSEAISVRSSLAFSDGFDDTKTWDDHDALDGDDVDDDVIHALNTSTPDEKRRSAHAQNRKLVTSSSTPPTSALVTKFFPQLKGKNEKGRSQVTELKEAPSPQITTAPPAIQTVARPGIDSGLNDGLNPGMNSGIMNSGMSNAVRDKLQELEKEIEKFREENIALHKLREEREKDLQELQKERTSFENYRTEELQRLENFKTEEEKRLRRDKRVFEQYQKASRALPDKREREEITSLKAKISELQEDLKLRESRWSAATTRYKDRINNLEKENREMKEEVKLLEKQNLDLQRKDQQKVRELQQYKAFEKKKLKKPEVEAIDLHNEMAVKRSPAVDVPQNFEQKDQRDAFNKDEELNTSPKNVHDQLSKCASPETQTAVQHSGAIEKRGIEKITVSECTESIQDVTKEYSPPTKLVSSSKSVRFKVDELEEATQPETSPKQLSHSDGKRETINPDGSRVVMFTNGTRKEISADGLSVIVTFFNGDVKQIFPDQRVEYYYAEVQTTHTTYPDGLEVLRFPSNQIEKHYPDGTKEIIFPDQTVKYLYTSGAEECVFTDGTVERITVDGGRVVEFPNGQRETYTKLFKKREYPDGTVKTVYTDGRQETRYASGRLRVKDGEGRLLVDTAAQNMQTQQGVAS